MSSIATNRCAGFALLALSLASVLASTGGVARAAPALEEFTFAGAPSGTSIDAAKSSGTSQGDLLIAIMVTDGNNETLTAPAGWTPITGNTGQAHTSRSWRKTAGASEPPTYTFTVSSNEAMTIGILRVTGHDPADPVDVWDFDTGSSRTPTAPSVTTTVVDPLVLRYYGADDDDYTGDDTGYPPGHTGVYRRQSGGSSGECHQGVAYVTQATPGPTGTASFTQDATEQWSAATIAIAPAPGPVFDIAGTVYEDVNGDADLGDAVGRPGADVAVYRDDGDGSPDAGDVLESTTTTIGGGVYSVSVPDGETYWVVVDSRTVSPTSPLNGGYTQDDVWAEQTYGSAGALASDGNGGTYERGSAGPCFGGRRGGVSDDASSLGGAEHVSRIVVNGSDVTGVDFGFSFDVVADVRDEDDDVGAGRLAQGCLNQFVLNANAVGGPNTMRFVPAIPTNSSGGGGDWWTVTLASALPLIQDSNTIIDGTAFSHTDGVAVRDDNPGTAGHGGERVGAGPDGIEDTGDELLLPDYDRPEFEIDGGDFHDVIEFEGDGQVLRRAAIFNSETAHGVNVNAGAGNEIRECFLGPRADGTDPGLGSRLDFGVLIGAGGADVTGSFVAHITHSGIRLQNASVTSGNDVYNVGLEAPVADGITVEGSAGQAITVRGNRIESVAAYGIESWQAPGPYTLEDNTVRNTGLLGGSGEDGGIRVFGTDNTIRRNVVSGAAGAGIVVVRGAAGASAGNTISKNVTYANGSVGIDLDQTNVAGNPNGDGVTPNDGALTPGDQNDGMDYPVFTIATLNGANLHIEGYVGTAASPLAGTHTVQVFMADDDGNNNGEVEAGDGLSLPHGEGRYYIGAFTTDADGTFSADLTVPAAVPLASGENLTGTARDVAGNTSEFGAHGSVVLLVPDIVLVKSAQTFSDPVNGETNPKAIPGAYANYTVLATNQGAGATDTDTVILSDSIPANTVLFVGDIDGPGSGPVLFADGATPSGLTYTFTSLDSATDDIEFSNDGGATFTHTPIPDPDGFDANVTDLRVNPKGSFDASDGVSNPSFTILFRIAVE